MTQLLRHRIPELVTVLAALLVLAIPGGVTLAREHGTVRDVVEGRSLAGEPRFPRSLDEARSFPAAFDAYINDRLVVRGPMIRARSRTLLSIGVSPSPTVELGRDGWLFMDSRPTGDALNDSLGMHRYTRAQLRALASRVRERQHWLARRGIPYVVMPGPNKETIYLDKVPATRPVINTDTALRQYIDTVAAAGVPVVDARSALRDARGAGSLEPYFKTDTHWNTFGAAIAQRMLQEEAHAQAPNLARPTTFDARDFRLARTAGHDLARSVGDPSISERSPSMTSAGVRKLCRLTYDRPPRGHTTFTTTSNTGTGTAIVFRDSFFIALVRYTSCYYRTVTYVWVERRSFFTYPELAPEVARRKPDIVLHEFVERKLPQVPPNDPRWKQ